MEPNTSTPSSSIKTQIQTMNDKDWQLMLDTIHVLFQTENFDIEELQEDVTMYEETMRTEAPPQLPEIGPEEIKEIEAEMEIDLPNPEYWERIGRIITELFSRIHTMNSTTENEETPASTENENNEDNKDNN